MIRVRKDLYAMRIPDVWRQQYYQPEEIEGAVHLITFGDTGNVMVRLADGRVAVLYSIDLE